MTSLENEAKDEGFSYSWSSIPGLETAASERPFAYSWSSAGPEPAAALTEVDPRAPQEDASPAGATRIISQSAILGILESVPSRIFGIRFRNVRNVGAIGWSAIAGSGAIVAIVDASPSVASQLETIGGLWLGVLAAIWFLPTKVLR